jgi:Uma2 family endonuclease
MQPAPRTRLTYDDFLQFPDDGLRHELIDGEHYATPSPNFRHQQLSARLFASFVRYLDQHPESGEALYAPLDVVFTQYDVVEPDLLFIGANRTGVITEKNIQGAPSLVIEILSPGTRKRDKGIKRDLFARGDVEEYWMVDPDHATITVHRRAADESFPCVDVLAADRTDVLRTPLLPDFALSLADLFR